MNRLPPRWLPALVCLIAVSLSAGCVSAPHYPPAPARVDKSAHPAYLVGPGDVLNVNVWRNPEVSGQVPVRPDGKISTPLVEDLQASGRTTSDIAREVEKALSQYIKNPVVTVSVQTFTGSNSQVIKVVGQATKAQVLPYRENMTLLDVVIAIGGITDFAAGNRATIWRGQKQYSVRLEDLVRGGDISANVEMLPGDVLMIPENLF